MLDEDGPAIGYPEVAQDQLIAQQVVLGKAGGCDGDQPAGDPLTAQQHHVPGGEAERGEGIRVHPHDAPALVEG